MPDIIYDALWNGEANTQDPAVPATDWARHQRIHQYLGGQNASYGGDTINIDRDYLDVQQQAVAGGSAQASPAAAQSTGEVDAFFRGADGQLWHDSFSARRRLAPPGQPGRLAGQPAVRGDLGAGRRGRVRHGYRRAAAGRPLPGPGRAGQRCAGCGWACWAASRPRWRRPMA